MSRFADKELDAEERKRRVRLINECGGILPTVEAIYIQSIMHVGRASLDAFERFRYAVVQNREDAIVVSAVQEALTHAAALSRFFWPAREKDATAARAKKLREAFGMQESPLKDRGLRNDLEHFDERLDEYFLHDPVGVFLPSPLVRPHELADDPTGHIFRLVDPYDLVFVLLGKKYKFGPVWEEVERILALADRFDRNGGRLRLLT